MIPLATTTISVLRESQADASAEPYQGKVASDRAVVVSKVRATISAPATRAGQGQEITQGGEQVRIAFTLACDPVDLRHTDWIRDDGTGEVFKVVWATRRIGFGLDHTQAQMYKTEGLV